MNREQRRRMAECPFRTVFLPGANKGQGGDWEAFLWTKPTAVPPCEVVYVANAIRNAPDAGRSFYLLFKYREPRETMKRALLAAGINARQGVVQ